MDIPCLSKNLYYKIQNELDQVWKESLWLALEEAGKLEREAAIKEGHVDSHGIPYITDGYLDGGWSKRSYGHTYNENSGAAVIIGKTTGKVLFVGVRNKYCCICARAENNNEAAKTHICFKNWSGSSSSMEQDIIVEGFNNSIEMHGLKYLKFIADGDSSVFKNIKEKVPYGHEVVKIECMNHVLKNFSKNLYKIKKDTQGVPVDARKMLKSDTINELNKSVQSAIYANTQDPENLRADIRNSIYHVYGNHSACKQYLFTNTGDVSNDRTTQLISSGLHHHLFGAIEQLLMKADLLLYK
ncbi:uncharacterized protein LOC126265075 [Aethina tumida]|uniref:uncharacterized protein LOC126265075 n=1 Tax=Aethina tumida TaxID=116153 RepID=UPI0021487344|nr:uncharacterized protein LOC126265075 [Aethina tumida]